MSSWEDDQFTATSLGENPRVLAELTSGWAVLGDNQHLPGYSLLLHRDNVDQLTDLGLAGQIEFLTDLAVLGQAVVDVCSTLDPAFQRVNYAVMGNKWPHLHGHVHPRYGWEAPSHRVAPVWRYPTSQHRPLQLAGRHGALQRHLVAKLTELMATSAPLRASAQLRG